MFNDTGLEIRTDLIKKTNYNYITRFKLCISLYPLLILTRTPSTKALNKIGFQWKHFQVLF